MLIIERVVELGTVPLFAGLPDHTLAVIASQVEEVGVGAGMAIVTEGVVEDWMFILVSGSATVSVGGSALTELGAGSVIGEMAVLDPGPRSAAVVANEDSLLFRIGQAELTDVMFDHPELMMNIINVLVARLRSANTESSGGAQSGV